MTREEIRQILGEGATEEQVTGMLNLVHNKEKELNTKITDLQNTLDSQNDYQTIKKELEDINTAKMTEQERLAKEKEEISKNLRDSKIILNTAKAKEILSGLNIDDDTLKTLVTDDETSTVKNATNWANYINNIKENVAKETTEKLVNASAKPEGSNNPNSGEMTFDNFSKMSAEEQNEYLSNNPNALNEMN